MKRIGIDGSALIKDQPTGVEVMTQGFIYSLFKCDKNNRYFIYTPRPLTGELLQFPNVTNQVGKAVKFWTQTTLPLMARKDNLDIFWSPSNILPRSLKCKTLATVHDLAFMKFPRCYRLKDWFLSWLTARRAVNATCVMTISRQTKQDFIRYFGASPDKVKVIYCALPHTHKQASPNEIRRRYSLPDKFLLAVGRIEPRKNSINIMKAFAEVVQEMPDLHLVFVGPASGKYPRRVQMLADRAGLHSRVHLLGFVPLDDLFTMYQMAEVLVFPSLYEGFGIPILEAWAARTPVLTSNTGATKEVAEDAAALVNPLSASDIADKIRILLKDESVRAKYIQAGTSRLQQFSWRHSASRLKDILENL